MRCCGNSGRDSGRSIYEENLSISHDYDRRSVRTLITPCASAPSSLGSEWCIEEEVELKYAVCHYAWARRRSCKERKIMRCKAAGRRPWGHILSDVMLLLAACGLLVSLTVNLLWINFAHFTSPLPSPRSGNYFAEDIKRNLYVPRQADERPSFPMLPGVNIGIIPTSPCSFVRQRTLRKDHNSCRSIKTDHYT